MTPTRMSRALAALAAAVLLYGCMVPTTRAKVETRTERGPRQPQVPGLVTLVATTVGPTVTVVAVAERECRQDVFEVVRTTHRQGATVDGPDDPAGMLLAVVFWPVTLVVVAVSAVRTTLAVNETAKTTERRHRIETQWSACPWRGQGLLVRLTLPSGATLERTTDALGTVRFHVPATEPGAGVVTAVVAGGASGSVLYAVDRAACVAYREARLVDSVTAPEGRFAALRALPSCPATTEDDRQNEQLWTTIGRAVLAAVAGDCARAVRLGEEVRVRAPAALHDRFRADPAIAACDAARPRASVGPTHPPAVGFCLSDPRAG